MYASELLEELADETLDAVEDVDAFEALDALDAFLHAGTGPHEPLLKRLKGKLFAFHSQPDTWVHS